MPDIRLNLVVIRSADIDRAMQFYHALGLTFEQHQHGKGLTHYAAEMNGVVFEVYPAQNEAEITASVRLGLQVASVEKSLTAAQAAGGQIVSEPKQSLWGLRAVVTDPDGHRIELTEITTH